MESEGQLFMGDTIVRDRISVCVATGLYPPEIGGPATYTKMLETEMPEYNIFVHVVPFGWVRRYPKIVRHIAYAWKLFRESAQADLIYALDPVSVGFPASIVARLRSIPFMLRVAGDYAWEQGQQRFGVTEQLDSFVVNPKQPFFVRLLQKLQTHVACQAKRVVVPSEYMKGIVASWGIEKEKITRIYSALFPIPVTETKSELRSQLEYEGPVITTAGRLVPWKGVPALLCVVAECKKKDEPITLVVIGDGPERQYLETYAVDLGVSDWVRFVGQKTKESLGAAIKASDVFVLNTAYEGLSHQLLEVMDLGVPIVTTAVGGNTELIEDKKQGLLVPFDDIEALTSGVKRLIEEGDFRDQIVKRARAHVKNFSIDMVSEEVASLLKETAS